MKFFGKSKSINNNNINNKTILFVCVENAGRSQMAEGFFKKYAPKGFNSESAGTKPVSHINPIVVEAMREVGIDISNQKSKEITEEMMRGSEPIVNMGCMDKSFCPTLFLPKVIEWNLKDPKGKSIEEVREIRDEIEKRVKLKDKLFSSKGKKVFFAEFIGTFIVVTLATGSVVIDAKLNGALGLPFIAIAPAIAVAIGVYLFGKVSMAHFNPAVTLGFLITGHIKQYQLINYFIAEIFGAILASLFVKYFIGSAANLGANAPNYNYPLSLIFGVEVLATALLMTVICIVVYTKGLRGFSGIVIGGIVGLDIFLFGLISGASMNPARSLAPAIVSGYYVDIWLYLTAPFIGTSIVALLLRKKFYKINNKESLSRN